MAQVCSTNRFILSATPTPGVYWFYDKRPDKKGGFINSAYIGTVDDFYEIPDGSVIGVTNYYEQNRVYLMQKISTQVFGYPAQDIILQSTSGDQYNRLLSAVATGYTLTVRMYALTAKEITELTFDLPQVYNNESPAELYPNCYSDYYLEANVLLTSYCNGVTLVEVRSDGAGGITTTTTANSLSCGYVERLDPVIFTESKLIELRKGCFKNPVYLTWRNNLGGWDYWLFEWKQTEDISTSDVGEFFKNYNSLSEIKSFGGSIGKDAIPTMTLFTDMLNENRKRAISQILYSPKVYILGKDGIVINEVSVLPGSFRILDNSEKTHSIEMQIALPEINTLRN